MTAANKTSNSYVRSIGEDVYAACPKAVLAAIAVSFASMEAREIGEETRRILLREWATLHDNGIAPQSVPSKWHAEMEQ